MITVPVRFKPRTVQLNKACVADDKDTFAHVNELTEENISILFRHQYRASVLGYRKQQIPAKLRLVIFAGSALNEARVAPVVINRCPECVSFFGTAFILVVVHVQVSFLVFARKKAKEKAPNLIGSTLGCAVLKF